MNKKVQIVDMNGLLEVLKECAGPDGVIQVMTPQFERTDGRKPLALYPWNDQHEFFNALPEMPHEMLIQIGMGVWEPGHYLYPYEWYDFIPENHLVTFIDGSQEPFVQGKTDNDMRYGMLAYGFKKV